MHALASEHKKRVQLANQMHSYPLRGSKIAPHRKRSGKFNASQFPTSHQGYSPLAIACECTILPLLISSTPGMRLSCAIGLRSPRLNTGTRRLRAGPVASQLGLPDSARRRVGSCSKRLRNNQSTYARALAIELAPIRVNAVSPGVLRTNLWQNMNADQREQLYESVGKSLPVGRVGEAHDVAQACLFLMQEGFSTGQTVVVDGGTVLVQAGYCVAVIVRRSVHGNRS